MYSKMLTHSTVLLGHVMNVSRVGVRKLSKMPMKSNLFESARKIPCLSPIRINLAASFAKKIPEGVVTVRDRLVGGWLLGCAGMTFGAVILGGVTRLTESGLSMVDWKLFGERPPFSEKDWIKEFQKYKEYPEFKLKNSEMTLSDFKWIWWMEYSHRTWGRMIGAAFYIPAFVFWYRGYLNAVTRRRSLVLGIMLGCQGLMGWYMVKSGLDDRFHGESDVPRVSQYRLASHLALAFVFYSYLLWSAMDLLIPAAAIEPTRYNFWLKKAAHGCKGLVFLTAISGAFVAGLDAGLVYNSFPKMADRWIPDDIMSLAPKRTNLTENPTTVQFEHRVLGVSTLTSILAFWIAARRAKISPRARIATHCMGVLSILQVILGISTLLNYVPTPLAAAHQSGSLTLLSSAMWLTHELKRIPKF